MYLLMYICITIYILMCIYIYTYMYACMDICMCVCVCVCVYIYIYTCVSLCKVQTCSWSLVCKTIKKHPVSKKKESTRMFPGYISINSL